MTIVQTSINRLVLTMKNLSDKVSGHNQTYSVEKYHWEHIEPCQNETYHTNLKQWFAVCLDDGLTFR